MERKELGREWPRRVGNEEFDPKFAKSRLGLPREFRAKRPKFFPAEQGKLREVIGPAKRPDPRT